MLTNDLVSVITEDYCLLYGETRFDNFYAYRCQPSSSLRS